MLFRGGRVRVGAIGLDWKRVVMCLLLGCCSAGGTGHAWAQTSVDGAISGFVVDASGAALAGAVVQVHEVATGLTMETKTGSKGEFLVARVRGDREEDAAGRAGLLIATVNGVAVAESAMARALLEAGFVAGAMGFNVRRVAAAVKA